MELEEFDFRKAMTQITTCSFSVNVPRLTQHEIDSWRSDNNRIISRTPSSTWEAGLAPSKRRNVKRLYSNLSFDDEQFFEKACMADNELLFKCPSRKRRRRKHVNQTIKPENTVVQPDINTSKVTNVKDIMNVSDLYTKILTNNESSEKKTINKVSSDVTYSEIISSVPSNHVEIKCVPDVKTTGSSAKTKLSSNEFKKTIQASFLTRKLPVSSSASRSFVVPKESVIVSKSSEKIRVKTAAELGSTVLFLDYLPPKPIVTTNANVICNHNGDMDIQFISNLYKKFFTEKNQIEIKNVAEILQSLSSNAKWKNETFAEINNNKEEDFVKLRLRNICSKQFDKHEKVNKEKLQEKFQAVTDLFEDSNFETLFQLFFLGILKVCIVGAYSYKKNTLFKKLVYQLSESLKSSGYKDDRVFNILKAPDFRSKCIKLVKFIEQYSRTEFFKMFSLTGLEEQKLLKTKELNTNESPVNIESGVPSCSKSNTGTNNSIKDNTANSLTPNALLSDFLSKGVKNNVAIESSKFVNANSNTIEKNSLKTFEVNEISNIDSNKSISKTTNNSGQTVSEIKITNNLSNSNISNAFTPNTLSNIHVDNNKLNFATANINFPVGTAPIVTNPRTTLGATNSLNSNPHQTIINNNFLFCTPSAIGEANNQVPKNLNNKHLVTVNQNIIPCTTSSIICSSNQNIMNINYMPSSNMNTNSNIIVKSGIPDPNNSFQIQYISANNENVNPAFSADNLVKSRIQSSIKVRSPKEINDCGNNVALQNGVNIENDFSTQNLFLLNNNVPPNVNDNVNSTLTNKNYQNTIYKPTVNTMNLPNQNYSILNNYLQTQPNNLRIAVLEHGYSVSNNVSLVNNTTHKKDSNIQCANKNCAKKAEVVCGRCKCTYYCGHYCQKIDWNFGHDQICKNSEEAC